MQVELKINRKKRYLQKSELKVFRAKIKRMWQCCFTVQLDDETWMKP